MNRVAGLLSGSDLDVAIHSQKGLCWVCRALMNDGLQHAADRLPGSLAELLSRAVHTGFCKAESARPLPNSPRKVGQNWVKVLGSRFRVAPRHPSVAWSPCGGGKPDGADRSPPEPRARSLHRKTFTSKDHTSNATRCIDEQIPVHTRSAPKCHCMRLPASGYNWFREEILMVPDPSWHSLRS
jgi:hypothetical protein